jgi:hypothetical protein
VLYDVGLLRRTSRRWRTKGRIEFDCKCMNMYRYQFRDKLQDAVGEPLRMEEELEARLQEIDVLHKEAGGRAGHVADKGPDNVHTT